jgi:hypothetical protein
VDLGVIPVAWRWGLDLFGQIGLRLGFLFTGWFLQWPEVLASKRSTIFVNKAGGPAGAVLRRGGSIPSLPLSCRGGEGRCVGVAFLVLRWFLLRWRRRFVIDSSNQARGSSASAIYGRCGGHQSTTSRKEALLHPRGWSSASCRHQVVRPRWCPGVRRRRIYARKGCSGVCVQFLGGDALRMAAYDGRDSQSQGLDCFSIFSPRVFFALWQASSSNIGFFSASDVKGTACKYVTCHVF